MGEILGPHYIPRGISQSPWQSSKIELFAIPRHVLHLHSTTMSYQETRQAY